MKITCLIENNENKEKTLRNEHGLSLLIEYNKKRILFDSGQSNNLIFNAKDMGINLSLINYFILSHAHYDHTGSILEIADMQKSKKDLYVGKNFFEEKYKQLSDNQYKYIGVSFDKSDVEEKFNLIEVNEDILKIDKNIYLARNFEEKYEKLNSKLLKIDKNKYVLDNFEEEMALVIDTKDGLVVFVGCSHVGVVNILCTIKKRFNKNIYAFIGGTHLVNEELLRIKFTIEYLKQQNVQKVVAIHCTGKKAEKIMKSELKEKFIDFNTGSSIKL